MQSVSSSDYPPTTDTTLSHPNHIPMPTSTRFGLKSNNVFLHEHFEPTEAIILIENGKIVDVILPNETTPDLLAQVYNDWDIKDQGNLYIFPGLVDSNVHLHADFNSEWENIAYCNEAAAAGGVTTIIDNPIMSKPFDTGSDYVESLQQKIKTLKDNCKVDFGVFAALEPRTINHVGTMLETGVMGLKCFLLSCMQDTIGHFSSETFSDVVAALEKHKDLLIMVHPEVATERDLYLTSPCRTVALEKRLDKKHVIKSLELGGAANKGSYLDELCKKSTTKDEDDDDDDCPTATLDTPTKLKGKIKKTKEKNEIDDLVHFELLSYGYTNGQKEEKEKDDDSSSDSDLEVSSKKKGKANSLPTCAEEVAENCGENQDEEEQENQSYLSNLPHKKSMFSRIARGNKVLQPLNENQQEKEEQTQEKEQEQNQNQDQNKECLILRDEPSPMQTEVSKEDNAQAAQVEKVEPVLDEEPLQLTKAKSFVEPAHPLKLNKIRANHSETNKTLTKTRKFLTFLTACDVNNNFKQTDKPNPQTVEPIITIEGMDKKEPEEIKTFPIVTNIIDRAPKLSSGSMDSLNDNLAKSQIASPAISSRPMTPASSSLLQRRLSRKSSYGVAGSVSSTLSSPSSDFTKLNSLDVIKSPRSLAKKEAQYNQSYRIFLANRPQNWEENAVTLVLSCIKPHTSIRLLLPNLSLASSFLKVREKKKAHQDFVNRIFSDASPAHLFFNEKMVKKGDTKYKVSPPFRNKENRRLLVENFRLGGIDLVSSYHFYVPPRFKNIDDGNFRRAFGGLDTMGYSLQAVWTAAYSHQQKTNKRFSEDVLYQKKIVNRILWQMSQSMCYNPAQMLKIGQKKGMIAKGRDADLVLWDPYKVVNANDRGPNHVFSGKSLLGEVSQTYLRGNLIYDKENGDQISKDYKPEFIRPE